MSQPVHLLLSVGGERSLFTLATCVKPGKKALLSIIQHFFSLPFKWFNAQTALITYLGLVEHHLFRGEVGHRTEPAAAGGSAGAQCAEEDWGGEPSSGSSGYYMHDSGTRLLFTQRDKKKKQQRSPTKCEAAAGCGSVCINTCQEVDGINGSSFAPMWWEALPAG